jgi:putative acetyltransferase
MKIRAATLSDTEEIAHIHRESIRVLCSGHYDARRLAGWIELLSPEIYASALAEKWMIVAEQEGRIVGMGILDPGQRQIAALYVAPGFHGQGVGTRLLAALEKAALDAGADQLELGATLNSRGFYRRHGYLETGRDFHELPNGIRLECIRMKKTFD